MIRTLHVIHLCWLGIIPALGVVIQGWEADATGILAIAQWIFGIVLVALMVMKLPEPETKSKAVFMLLLGPVMAILLSLLAGNGIQYMLFNNYLIEGACFMMYLFVAFIKNRKRGLNTQGPWIVYVATPILFAVFGFGFFSTINTSFFTAYYSTVFDYIGLAVTILVGLYFYYHYMLKLDQKYTDEDGTPNDEEMEPFRILPLLIGIFLWIFRSAFYKWDWFMDQFNM